MPTKKFFSPFFVHVLIHTWKRGGELNQREGERATDKKTGVKIPT
jgi:hypothetical protein